MGATCGVITSGLMILGMAGKGETAVAKKYVDGFRERHNGVLNCAELLRINAEKGGTRKPHCDGMVYEAITALEEMLK